MEALDIARRMARLGRETEARQAYMLALSGGEAAQEERLEGAVYILRTGGDYRVAYTVLCRLYNSGALREECLSVLTRAFYQPNVKQLRSRYEKNCKALSKYPYLFRKDFPAFEDLPVLFFPYDDKGFLPFYPDRERFGDYWNPRDTVISRSFFKDLENPILAEDVYSQYELEYLYDNVRRSEDVARENHIYLHYPDWGTFCARLQCLNLRRVLDGRKIVFLIGDEISLYPIDFKERYGIDYSQYPPRPVGVRDISRLIWHTQLSSHNGGDFFNEIFDGHPNLLYAPSVMFDSVEDTLEKARDIIRQAAAPKDLTQFTLGWPAYICEELYQLRDQLTEKDLLVALVMSHNSVWETLDLNSRIAPAVFFQPHFYNMKNRILSDGQGHAILRSEVYDKLRRSPILTGFPYIKTFTPMRRFTTSHGATVKFMEKSAVSEERKDEKEKKKERLFDDALSYRVFNRSFMIDPEDRLYRDSVLVRFEDGKLNPKATFTALAAFLDLPYTESMTYCSLLGKRDPESLPGNDLGFSTAAIYRTYDDYVNDAERYFIEYLLRDAYEYYGYGFQYYDGATVDEKKLEELIAGFTTMDHYIRESWWKRYQRVEVSRDGERVGPELELEVQKQLLERRLKEFSDNRLRYGKILLQGLEFVNQNGQPLHMMPKLELDPALLEQPLYH